MPFAVPPRAWLVATLAAAPWLFWTCPLCWVLALLSPAAQPEAPAKVEREPTAPPFFFGPANPG